MLPHSNHSHYYANEEPDISSFLLPPPASLHEYSSVTINPPGRPQVLPPPATSAAVENRATGESPELLPCRRKYRRSKICTAQGLRDRRMRLSLDVAGKFFYVQDLLGFDKASKTVQWLLSKSKNAIKELTIPAMREAPPTSDYQFEEEEEDIAGEFTPKAEQRTSIVVKSLRTRESRQKARERARQRTLEKKRMKIEYCGGQDHEETDRDNASAELLFDYDYQTVDCLFQEPWEMDFRVNFDEGVLLDW